MEIPYCKHITNPCLNVPCYISILGALTNIELSFKLFWTVNINSDVHYTTVESSATLFENHQLYHDQATTHFGGLGLLLYNDVKALSERDDLKLPKAITVDNNSQVINKWLEIKVYNIGKNIVISVVYIYKKQFIKKLVIDNKPITGNANISNTLNQYVATIGNGLSCGMSVSNNHRKYLVESNQSSLFLAPGGQNEINKELGRLKSKKACGLDEITKQFIKFCRQEPITSLSKIILEKQSQHTSQKRKDNLLQRAHRSQHGI